MIQKVRATPTSFSFFSFLFFLLCFFLFLISNHLLIVFHKRDCQPQVLFPMAITGVAKIFATFSIQVLHLCRIRVFRVLPLKSLSSWFQVKHICLCCSFRLFVKYVLRGLYFKIISHFSMAIFSFVGKM